MQRTEHRTVEACYHCGEPCTAQTVRYDAHAFCCAGCSSVYQVLQSTGLCQYYTLDAHAGINPTKNISTGKWKFLDDDKISNQLISFRNNDLVVVSFHVPAIHCSSCIFLLENLSRIASGVISSEVNFLKKEVNIKFIPGSISLRKVVETMASIGYPPLISLQNLEHDKPVKHDKQIYYKIGIAGFCFANIMILSLPEYFDLKNLLSADFINVFRYLNLALIVPVLFYSASDYFRSAWYAIKHLRANMDFAISMGIGGLAVQSVYDVISGSGAGYFDSMSGLIFFLLVGKFIQQRTFEALSFDRDYKSYFPLAITRVNGEKENSVNVNDITPGDEILVHNQELIPADSMLESKDAWIDYSFVTGESQPVLCHQGETIYAGGRNYGPRLKMQVIHTVSQSYLTRLWNDKAFEKGKETGLNLWATQIANGFTIAVITIAIVTGIYWQMHDPSVMMRAVTSVLIVACPCVMALSIPFTFGQIMRILGKNGLYLKNGPSIEKLSSITAMVFDKTGTLTYEKGVQSADIVEMKEREKELFCTAIAQSMHPVSRALKRNLGVENEWPISNWEETIGKGISATIDGEEIRIGGRGFVIDDVDVPASKTDPKTYISLNGSLKGSFFVKEELRVDIKELALELDKNFSLFILSGDNDRQRQNLEQFFPASQLYFNQSPQAKLSFVESLRKTGEKVLMIGDGLNDAGALKASDFGITVTNDINSFTPASDAILDSSKLGYLPRFASLARDTKKIVFGALFFSLAYNCIGLSFAVQGHLQPWVAAILMPISSITVVLYTRLATQLAAKKNKL